MTGLLVRDWPLARAVNELRVVGPEWRAHSRGYGQIRWVATGCRTHIGPLALTGHLWDLRVQETSTRCWVGLACARPEPAEPSDAPAGDLNVVVRPPGGHLDSWPHADAAKEDMGLLLHGQPEAADLMVRFDLHGWPEAADLAVRFDKPRDGLFHPARETANAWPGERGALQR